MARYFRRRYRRYRPYRRYYRRRYYKRRYVNTNSRSSVKVRINFEWQGQVTCAQGTGVSTLIQYSPFKASNAVNHDGALHSALYRNYCDLYDEVKCNAMKVKMNIINNIGTAEIPSLTVHTGWDRRKPANYGGPTFDEIAGNPAYRSSICLNNNVAKFSRSIIASDIQERSMFHDSRLDPPIGGGNYEDIAYQAYGAACPFFAPGFYCYLQNSNTARRDIDFVCQCTYWFTFRSPKYGLTQAAAKDDFRGPGVPPDAPDGGDDGDMDGGAAGGFDDDDDDNPGGDDMPGDDFQTKGVKRTHESPPRDKYGRVMPFVLDEDGGDILYRPGDPPYGPGEVTLTDSQATELSAKTRGPKVFNVNRGTPAEYAATRGGKFVAAAGTAAATAGAAMLARLAARGNVLD